jgi:hypothetical protein
MHDINPFVVSLCVYIYIYIFLNEAIAEFYCKESNRT